MALKFKILPILILFLFSCQKREWDNPFDPDCPKEIFTPTGFQASQFDNLIKLTWQSINTNFEGFIIYRNANDGTLTEVARLDKGIKTWNDVNITGGKKYGYQLFAYANENKSNPQTIYITPLLKPTVTTSTVLVYNPDIAESGGTVGTDGGSPVTTRGVCYNTSPNPSISNNRTMDGTGMGKFSSTLSGLNSSTTYYLKAYATNSVGTSYDNEISFKTLEPNTVKDYDSNIYQTVQIGNQIWMKENLKTTKFGNGESILYWSGTNNTGYCWYNHDANYKNTYGAIYNYYTAMDSRGICPLGWHVPSIDDWTKLSNFLGGANVAGGKLKETGTIHWNSPNAGAVNEVGFNALPGGSRDCGNNFILLGSRCDLWTSKPVSGGWVSGININFNSASILIGNSGFDCNASYVRCVKD